MAALNFPDPNVTTSYTNPDTGITYEWANGVWKSVSSALTAPELFVDVEGDNLTGNLTLGTDKIVLNATDGSTEFAGPQILGTSSSPATNGYTSHVDNTEASTAACFSANNHNAHGINFLGVDGGNGNAITCKIMNDGSAMFAGNVVVGNDPFATGAAGVAIDKSGTVSAGTSGGVVWYGTNTTGGTADVTSRINADGSATFAGGDVVITGSGNVKSGDPDNSAGSVLSPVGQNYARQDGAGSSVAAYSVQNGGTTAADTVARINYDGSASFAGKVETIGNTAAFHVGTDKSASKVPFNIYDTANGNETIARIQGDGSATFAGNLFVGDDCSISGFNGSANFAGSDIQLLADGSAYFASNVGIGTTSPTSLGSSFTEVMISGNTEGAGLQLQDTNGNVKAGIFTSDISNTATLRTITNHPLTFRTNNIEAMRILSTGGLTFNGDTAQANALDDYEEGTFQVSVYSSHGGFVATVGNTTGHYIKIGKQVTCHWYSSTMSISNAGSGSARIGGLPFVTANTVDLYPVASFSHNTTFTTPTNGGYMTKNANYIVPTMDDSTTQAQWIAGNPRYVMFSASYIAA